MLNPSTDPSFTGKVNAPTPSFPNGSARDATVLNDPAATPLLAKKFNDDWGFDAALLAAAGLTANGQPDTALVSQRLDAIKTVAARESSLPNELSNSHFYQPTPDPLITPVDITPRDYSAGDQVFLGWFVSAGGITGLSRDPANGNINRTLGSIYQDVPKSGPLGEYTGALVASWGDNDGKPTEDVVVASFTDEGDYYRLTLTPNGCFSAKMEQGVAASKHLALIAGDVKTFKFDSVSDIQAASGMPIGDRIYTNRYYSDRSGGGNSFTVNPVGTASDPYVDILMADGRVAVADLGGSGSLDFKQVGVKVFDSIADAGFESVDAGVVLNALNASRVLMLTSNQYGKVHLKTQYIDTKGMYFVVPRPSKIDTASEESFDIVCDKDTVFTIPAEGPFTIKSGVPRGGIVGMILSGGVGETFDKIFSLGDLRYSVDTDNIISNYHTDGFITRGGNHGVYSYQYFNCTFKNTQNRDYRLFAWWTAEGGTSCHWTNCFPLSRVVGAKGIVWDPESESQGHIYSSMTGCAPQLVSNESFIFRNCGMTLTACGEEFSSYDSDASMVFVGTGNYIVQGYILVSQNANKPKNIFGVKPTPSGRFGATLTIAGTAIGVTGFSGTKVGFMHYGVNPTSILSRARWDISNTNQKSDPTNAIDYETWRAGYYYNTFVILKDQLETIETYLRSGQNTAIIPIQNNTRYTITGNITTAGGAAYVTFEVEVGTKTLGTASRVDVVATATADTTNRGKILHIDTGLDQTYSTGNVYLKAFNKSAVDIFASFSADALRVEFEEATVIVGQTGIWTITKALSASV